MRRLSSLLPSPIVRGVATAGAFVLSASLAFGGIAMTFALAGTLTGALASTLSGCGGKKPAKTTDPTSTEDSDGGGASGTDSTSASAADGGKDDCIGFEVDKLDEALMKASCEMVGTGAAQGSTDMKDKLEVRVSPFPTKVAPGGTMDVVVSFINKSKDPLTLYFQINPEPHFTIEAYDGKNRRADIPNGNPPPFPKDVTQPESSEPKVAKYTLAPNGSGKVHLTWRASRQRWAPEKVKGAILERGYPRSPAGNLPKGKYSLRIVTPLVGVFEGVEHEVSAPKIPIEVN